MNTQPFPSWILINEEWQAPVERKRDGGIYGWDEENLMWFKLN